MWDDPEFSTTTEVQSDGLEVVKGRRQRILAAVNDWYKERDSLLAKLAALTGWYKEYREASYCDIWTELELLQHVPVDIRNRISDDRNAKRRDPGFSFEEALAKVVGRSEGGFPSIAMEGDV